MFLSHSGVGDRGSEEAVVDLRFLLGFFGGGAGLAAAFGFGFGLGLAVGLRAAVFLGALVDFVAFLGGMMKLRPWR